MKKEDFLTISSTVRVYEARLLGDEEFRRLRESSDLDSFYKKLEEVGYGALVNSELSFEDAIQKYELDFLGEFYKLDVSKSLAEILLSEYVFHNLKVITRGYVSGQDLSNLMLEIPEYDFSELNLALRENRSISQMKYADIVESAILAYEEHKDPMELDLAIDVAYLEHIRTLAEKSEVELVKKFVRDKIDIANLNALLRANRRGESDASGLIIDGGNLNSDALLAAYDLGFESEIRTDSDFLKFLRKNTDEVPPLASTVERLSREFLNSYSDYAKLISYGPEVVFSYLLRKREEIAKIRKIESEIRYGGAR